MALTSDSGGSGEGAGDSGATGEGSTAPDAAPADVQSETLSDDDRIIEDLRREHFEKVEREAAEKDPPADKPKPKAKPAPKSKAKAEPAEGETERSQPGAKPATGAVTYESADAAVSAFVKALESGDVKAIARAVGKPEGFLDVTNSKWATFREQTNALRQRERTVADNEHTLNTRYAEAQKEFGPIIQAGKAYREGDYSTFVSLVEQLTGESYDEAQRKVIKGHLAVDPEVKKTRSELAKLREELAAEREKASKQTDEKTQEQKRAQVVEALTAELAEHPVAKLRGYQNMVLAKVRESYDAETNAYTMDFAEAADAVMTDVDEQVKALGYSRGQPTTPPARREETPAAPPRSRAAEAREPDGDPWLERDMTDEEIIASIHRDVRSGRIKV